MAEPHHFKVTGMFPTHTTFMAYYNVPVEVKFDIIVHLRDSTFTPAAMQSPTTYKFKEIPIEEANSQ